jgi:hypothetical protein
MTAARQERKSRRLLGHGGTLIGLTILAGAGLRPGGCAATTDQVVPIATPVSPSTVSTRCLFRQGRAEAWARPAGISPCAVTWRLPTRATARIYR